VKRQVWESDLELFRKHVFAVFKKYLAFTGPKINFFLNSIEPPKKHRDSNPVFEELDQILGTSFILYDALLHFCRTLFIKTKLPNSLKFCTFRYEILMYLHDNKLNKLFDADPIHQICVLFENWIKNGDSDQSKLKHLFSILKNNDKPLYGELSMVCASPTISIILQKAFVTLLEQKVNDSPLFDEPCLIMLCQLISATFDVSYQLNNIAPFPEIDSYTKQFVVLIVEMMKAPFALDKVQPMIDLFLKCHVARKILLLILPKWLNKRDEKKFTFLWNSLKELEPIILQEEVFVTSMLSYDPNSPWYSLFGPDLKKMKKK
jgi:hypothetical protein